MVAESAIKWQRSMVTTNMTYTNEMGRNDCRQCWKLKFCLAGRSGRQQLASQKKETDYLYPHATHTHSLTSPPPPPPPLSPPPKKNKTKQNKNHNQTPNTQQLPPPFPIKTKEKRKNPPPPTLSLIHSKKNTPQRITHFHTLCLT